MDNTGQTIRVPAEIMKSEFLRILIKTGFDPLKADKCAEVFTINSLEGVYSHGVNRFMRFVKNTREGFVKPDNVPTIIHRAGSIEQWDGNLGPGILNAIFATNRSTQLAKEHGMGMVALSNTNHWMRAGTYGWQAARKGFAFMCWTNTCPNMPAWGARDPRLGNNPFVMAVPYKNKAIVLDFAMSQFSYGKIESYLNEEKQLPFPGGFDRNGQLTTDPGEILETTRALPVGYWKGAGFSLLLDIMATILSGGLSTSQVKTCVSEHSLSQIFIAFDLKSLSNFPIMENSINQIIEDLKGSVPADENSKIRYPGESALQTREVNLKEGIPVNRGIWEKIISL